MSAADIERRRERPATRSSLEPRQPERVGPDALSLRYRSDDEGRAGLVRDRDPQRFLFDVGPAGVRHPRDDGGRGLTPAHRRVPLADARPRDRVPRRPPGIHPDVTS